MFRWLGKLVSGRKEENPAPVQDNAAAIARKQQGDLHLDAAAWGDAAKCYEQALALNPQLAAAHGNLGFALMQLRQHERASKHLQAALDIDPGLYNARYVLATLAHQVGDVAAAIAQCRNAVAAKPDFAEAWHYLGDLLLEQNDRAGAFQAYSRALELNPASTETLTNMAGLMAHSGDRRGAIAQYRRVLALDPHSTGARLNLVHELQQTCEWEGLAQEVALVRQAVMQTPATVENRDSPFSFLALPGSTAEEQKRCAEKWAFAVYQPQYHARQSLDFDFRFANQSKPHIGYLSADFHDHATARLMIEVFEQHDRDRYTFTAYSYGPPDQSAMTARLKNAFDRFIDIRHESILESARRIHADGVDILVDLKGYTGDSRSAILALGPAPIQVNYLGYPGTMGADFVDYLIADRFVIPEASQQHYGEEIVYLPDTYQPNDSRRPLAQAPGRNSVGLPERGLVFCCFNQLYKITPEIFDIWCRLLGEVEHSVLWLIGSDDATQENLRRQAERRGVAGSRLIFAPRTTPEEHLARQQCADLFLDTVPYNAHTTCSDALWMGLPVVTWAGETFASRVAGSLLTALGVPELIADSANAYHALALELAQDDSKRDLLRQKIIAQRHTAPLFDSLRFTRNLERAYDQMLALQEQKKQRIRIVIVAPDGYAHSRAFDEFAETLLHGFRALGKEVAIARNAFDRHGLNIVLGANLLTAETAALLPRRVVIYNLEQIYADSPWVTPTLLELFGKFEVWDYSRRNVAAIQTLAPQARVKFVPVGSMPQMHRIAASEEQDIDVLFYGSINDRRRHILDELAKQGVKVKAAFGVYGSERDGLIARAKLVLNMRLYDSDIFEIVRASYLLANGRAVVSECNTETDIEEDLRSAIAGAPYDQLVATCVALLQNPQARRELAERGVQVMAARNQGDILRAALGPVDI
jgi:predicted O-linked N-acetylglucosamine transferase (SPINDLY family)